jgi:hypothetical protein
LAELLLELEGKDKVEHWENSLTASPVGQLIMGGGSVCVVLLWLGLAEGEELLPEGDKPVTSGLYVCSDCELLDGGADAVPDVSILKSKEEIIPPLLDFAQTEDGTINNTKPIKIAKKP